MASEPSESVERINASEHVGMRAGTLTILYGRSQVRIVRGWFLEPRKLCPDCGRSIEATNRGDAGANRRVGPGPFSRSVWTKEFGCSHKDPVRNGAFQGRVSAQTQDRDPSPLSGARTITIIRRRAGV